MSTPEPNTPHASLGFPRRARITRGAELQRIAREGRRIRTMLLEVRVIVSPLVHPSGSRTRVGLIVPRFRHSAVARNRVKRRLRELSRTRILPADATADIVIRIRPEVYQAPFSSLAADIDRITAQLRRWSAGEPEPRTTSPDPPTGERSNDT